mgnify:FL=1
MKITVIIPTLNIGGAEKLTVNLINDWINKGHQIELLLLRKEGPLLEELNNNNLKIHNLNSKKLLFSFFPLYKFFKRNKIDIIWANIYILNFIVIFAWMLSGKKGKLFVTEHNPLSFQINELSKLKEFFLRFIFSLSYRFATGITTVSKGIKNDLLQLAHINNDKIDVIYNPVAIGKNKISKLFNLEKKIWDSSYNVKLLSVGNLKVQKNHKLLINTFAKLPKNLNAQLIIIGEGPLRKELEELINNLKLSKRISLIGHQKNPYPWYHSADLFILSSDYEGFGNVLIEALECGLPIVSTNCVSGPKEILENGKYGKLVEVNNVDDLKNGIIEQINKKHDKKKLIERSQDFLISKISDEYLSFFRTKE